MIDLLGFTSIALVSLLTTLIALRIPSIANILFTALCLRIFLMFVGYYGFSLPDSTFDAMGFERGAWERAESDFLDILFFYPVDSNYIKSVIAVPYSLLGRSLLMAQSISLFFGMGSVVLGWLLASKLWGKSTSIKVAWILAIFPSLVLYSVLTLREIYACFFLLLALVGVVNWVREKSYKSIILAMFGFFGATLFHGGIIIGGFIFLSFVVIDSINNLSKLLIRHRISPKNLLIVIAAITFLIFYFSNKIFIPKLGTFEEATNLGRLINESEWRLKGDASYPDWLKVETPIEFLTIGLIRIPYFLFSPFPWDVSKLIHLSGTLDGFLYMCLVYLVFRNIKNIWKDPALRIIFIILISYFFIFGIGVSNFGAGTRHRSKFVIELIILAAPLLPRFSFFKKLRKRNINYYNL